MSGVGITGNIVPLNGAAFTVYNGNPMPNLAALATLAGGVTGTTIWVQDQAEFYQLDTANSFVASSPLIIAATGGGNWFRKSKAYVVGNFFLWVCITSGFVAGDTLVLGYGPGVLAAGGGAGAEITLNLSAQVAIDGSFLNAVVPDVQGNLWVAAYGLHAVGTSFCYKLALFDCLQSGSPVPDVVVKTTQTTTGIQALAFDSQNNLWQMIFGAGGVTGALLKKINVPSYATSGAPTPDVIIQCDNGVVNEFQEGLFDGQGNFWTSSFHNGGTAIGGIQMVSAQQLAAGSNANLNPAVTWKGSNFDAPVGMCFGPTGLLWIVNYHSGGSTSRVRAYVPQGAVNGNPAPTIDISLTGFNGALAIEFDTAGNAWVICQDDSKIAFLTAAQLTASGAVAPTKFVAVPAGMFAQTLTFPLNPSRSGLVPSGVPLII